MDNLLSVLIFLPIIAATALGVILRGDDVAAQNNAKYLALLATGATFLISLAILLRFDPSDTGFQFLEQYDWIGGMQYKLGVDGISILFVMLTTALMPIVIGACWSVTERVKEYMMMFLILEGLMIAVFTALDLVIFYIVFEACLIPMFLIIGIWGGANRIYASFKFFLYTLLGSVFMLVAMVYMWAVTGTTDIPTLLSPEVGFPASDLEILGMTVRGGVQTLLFLAFFASFAVKMPMWPVHTWLPDAHVQAPTAGSVVLAAILLKMGGYGFLRFSLPMFPIGSEVLADFVMTLSVIAIIYTSFVALMQTDIKKLIAYSSVAHMGFVTMGIFALNRQGIDGAIFQMISHGFISGALFLAVGVIYDRAHTREIDAYGGLVNVMPRYALVFMFFTMANVGLPGTSGFVGEFLTLVGAFRANTWIAFGATSGVVLSAAYALWLNRRVMFGALIKGHLKSMSDMDRREKLLMGPLVLMTLLLGIYPALVLDLIGPSSEALVNLVESASQQFENAEISVSSN